MPQPQTCFRLQRQYADRETGLHYNFFRYYEPEAGWGNPLGISISTVIHMGKKVNILRSIITLSLVEAF